MERAYWNNEVAERLGMGKSTLRRWCLELEKIKKFQSEGNKLENAIEQALSERKQVPPVPVNTPRSPDLDLKAEREKLKQELLQEIKQELLGTEQRILERLEKRDQLLIQHVREIQETKRMVAAVQEEKWWQFWKK